MTCPDNEPNLDPNVLDLNVIEGLRELGGEDDPGLLLELVEMFLEDAPDRIREMEESMASGDLETMRRSAHTLKSSAANMGSINLSEICSKMEDAARQEETGSYAEMVPTAVNAFSEFEKALRQLS
jgi:HPt (histidine-containing phosphotransfer) domain-containing protein